MATPSTPRADSGTGRRDLPAAGAGRGALPVGLLGLNVWLAGVLWPLFATGERAGAAYGAAAACLIPLVVGAVLHGRGATGLGGRARTLAAAAWLIGFPVACGAVMTAWPTAGERALGTFGLVLVWLSLCVYAAQVARAVEARDELLATPELVLDPSGNGERPPPRRLRAAVIGLCVAGGAALTLIAPDLGALAPDADGDERAGAVLTAVVGGALGCTVVALFLASGLRTDAQKSEPRLDANLRAAWFVFVALLGAVTYYVVQP